MARRHRFDWSSGGRSRHTRRNGTTDALVFAIPNCVAGSGRAYRATHAVGIRIADSHTDDDDAPLGKNRVPTRVACR
jgi:hypothetical protein